jgi:hypothetical protein
VDQSSGKGEIRGQNNQKKIKAAERMRGMFTNATVKSGQCKFGGWNRDGMVRFMNYLLLLSRKIELVLKRPQQSVNCLSFAN